MTTDRVLLPLCLLAVLILPACNLPGLLPDSSPPPDTSASELTAEAVRTRSGADLIATGAALQTDSAPRTPTEAPTTPAETQAPCQNRAQFVDDVTIRDNSQLEPNETFVKIWRLRNEGSCVWTPAYLLSFFGGSRLMAPENASISQEVAPGETVDLAVDMKAPSDPGTYQGFWKLRSPEGLYFGIGPQGDQSFWVKIVVPTPPPEPSTPTVTPTLTLTPSATGEILTPTATATLPGTASPSPSPSLSPSPSPSATETEASS